MSYMEIKFQVRTARTVFSPVKVLKVPCVSTGLPKKYMNYEARYYVRRWMLENQPHRHIKAYKLVSVVQCHGV